MSKFFKKQHIEDEEEEYIGNIWGWKFSRIALIVILFFVIWVLIRQAQFKEKASIQTNDIELAQ